MHNRSKSLIFSIMKHAGLFHLARYHTRRGLRILCYHTLSWFDEHDWNPIVFMSEATFRQRMKLLHDLGAPVVPLDQIISGNYPDNAVVITFDDGWDTTYRAAEIMAEFGFSSTLYVATYHVEKQTQVFNVAMRYASWKTMTSRINLPEWNIKGNPKDAKVVDTAIDIAGDFRH